VRTNAPEGANPNERPMRQAFARRNLSSFYDPSTPVRVRLGEDGGLLQLNPAHRNCIP
jgi:hypothetical protein